MEANKNCWNGWPDGGNPACYCRQYGGKGEGYKMFPKIVSSKAVPKTVPVKTYKVAILTGSYSTITLLDGVTTADAAKFISDVINFASAGSSSITWRSAHCVHMKHGTGEYLVKTHLIQEILITEE
jgi:hypothetical protein